jgi:hypothetical protein
LAQKDVEVAREKAAFFGKREEFFQGIDFRGGIVVGFGDAGLELEDLEILGVAIGDFWIWAEALESAPDSNCARASK